jgi:putative ABC transport system substrate-binding protein
MVNSRGRRAFIRDVVLLSGALPLARRWPGKTTSGRVTRIGYLTGEGYPELLAVFRSELRGLGFEEGENVAIEIRLARPNTADTVTMAAELAGMDLALIVATALPQALEVRKANPAMPMVIGTCPGMVSNGFAQSLEHPGSIYTGMDELPPGVTAQRLRLLKSAAPSVTRVALLSTTPGRGGHETQVADAETVASSLGVDVRPYRAMSLTELRRALDQMAVDGMNGMLNFQGGLSLSNRQLIVEFMAEKRIPAIYQATLFADAGGLIAWAPDLPEQFREAARFVAAILNGAKPGDLPIRQTTRYFLTINAAAARRIGLALPQSLLAQATRVL